MRIVIFFLFGTHLQADKETDEIYAQMTLQPVNSVMFSFCFIEWHIVIHVAPFSNQIFIKAMTSFQWSCLDCHYVALEISRNLVILISLLIDGFLGLWRFISNLWQFYFVHMLISIAKLVMQEPLGINQIVLQLLFCWIILLQLIFIMRRWNYKSATIDVHL